MINLSDMIISDDRIKYKIKQLIELVHDDNVRLIFDMKSEDIRTISIYNMSHPIATFNFGTDTIDYYNELKKLLSQEMDFGKKQKEYYS